MSDITFIFNQMFWKYSKFSIIILLVITIVIIVSCFALAIKEVRGNKQK